MTRRNPGAFLVATWFGCGYAPKAPGTAGSLAGLAIAIALYYLGYGRGALLILTAILLAPGIWSASVVAKETNTTDPHIVVVDEVIGQWIALAGARSLSWQTYLAAFALFRLFDIWKPTPVRQLERLPEGWGINADDAMAGIYAALVLFAAGCFNLV
jgi:phosphatidylglycerophosphatase A